MTRRIIVVAVDEVDANAARSETLSLQLREELLSTGADVDARLTHGDAPPRTRGLDLSAEEQTRLINAFLEASEP